MANYSYQSSYSSGGGLGGAEFNQVDANHDGGIDPGEFRNFIGTSFFYSWYIYIDNKWSLFSGQNIGAVGGGAAGGSSYESSSFESSSSSAGLGGGVVGGWNASAGANGLASGASGYESSSFSSNVGYGAGAGQVAGGAIGLSGSSYESSSTQVQQYATDSQGLFNDPNPQIIRRAAIGGVQTYTQNIRVRFLQPPAVPPPGVSHLSDFSWSIP